MNCAAHMCATLPGPACANFAGSLRFIHSDNSANVSTGRDWRPTIITGLEVMRPTGAKSFSGSSPDLGNSQTPLANAS
jgi:hypothetical protein